MALRAIAEFCNEIRGDGQIVLGCGEWRLFQATKSHSIIVEEDE
jgi:hypothetical protein